MTHFRNEGMWGAILPTLNIHELNKWDEMEQLLKKHKLPQLSKCKKDHLNLREK